MKVVEKSSSFYPMNFPELVRNMIVVSTVHNSRLMHKRISVGFRNFVDVDINQQTLIRGCVYVFCLFLVRDCCVARSVVLGRSSAFRCFTIVSVRKSYTVGWAC